MSRSLTFALSGLLAVMMLVIQSLPAGAHAPEKGKKAKNKSKVNVQIAILLDTSGSMEGLIHQARTQLWKIVNDFQNCKKKGKRPELEVALYEYGKSSLPVTEGYLRQIVPFTKDLDLLSEKLFELKTNGGQEYCGWVIDDAVKNLEWSDRKGDLKMIFIAGNEPFSQGSVDFRDSCRLSIGRGITVNTIHCGDEAEGVRGHWSEGAALGEGSFLNIDHNDIRPTPKTPYDKRLIELSIELNTTYVPYGNREARHYFRARQAEQDGNAAEAAPSVAAGRAATKGSSFYDNSKYDILDALEKKKVKLSDIPKDELPEALQKLTPEKQEAYLARKRDERVKLQKEIAKLNQQRTQHLKASAEGDPTVVHFEDAVLKAVREQARAKSFEYQEN